MATGEKISALDTTTAQSTDLIPIARDGANYSVTAASIAAKVTATAPIVNTSGNLTFDPTAITTSAITPLTGTEIVALSQGGVTKKTTVSEVLNPSGLTTSATTPLTGTEIVAISQGGVTKKVTTASIAAKVTATAPIVNTSGNLTFDPTAITTSAITPLTGTEIVALSQGGVTKKTTVASLTAFRTYYVTDYADAQTAINAVCAIGNTTLDFGNSGTFSGIGGGPLNIPACTGVRFVGTGATISTNQPQAFIFLSGSYTDIEFNGLKIVSTETSTSGFSGLINSYAGGSLTNIRIIRCYFSSPTSCTNGVKIDCSGSNALNGLLVDGCEFIDIGQMGVEIINHPSPTDSVIRNTNVRVVNNKFYNLATACTAGYGMAVSYSGLGTGNVIANNNIQLAKNIGIEVVGCGTTSVTGNTLYDLKTGCTALYGARNLSYPALIYNITFTGNSVVVNDGYGIHLDNLSSGACTGNSITGTGSLLFSGCNDITLNGNNVHLNAPVSVGANKIIFIDCVSILGAGNHFQTQSVYTAFNNSNKCNFSSTTFKSSVGSTVVLQNGCVGNVFTGCTFDNETSSVVGSPLQFVDATTTGNRAIGCTFIRTSAGGTTWQQGSSATGNIVALPKVNVMNPAAGDYYNTPLTLTTGGNGYLQTVGINGNYVWTDSLGRLRIKSTVPTSNLDGTVVGDQSAITVPRSTQTFPRNINAHDLDIDGPLTQVSLTSPYSSAYGSYNQEFAYGTPVYFSEGWNGYKYWMVSAPYPAHMTQLVSMTIASPSVFTSTPPPPAGTAITFSTTGALPTGLSTSTVYYVISTGLTDGTFQISTSVGGTAVNTSGTQSGTHTLHLEVGGQATISIASPAVITCAKSPPIGTWIYFSTTGALPTGLSSGAGYLVLSSGWTSTAFQITATTGGTAITTSGTQSGVHSFSVYAPKYENPYILVSNDGNSWVSPPNITQNPIYEGATVATGTDGPSYYVDPYITASLDRSKLYCIWLWSSRTGTIKQSIMVSESSDGLTWSSPVSISNSTSTGFLPNSPSLIPTSTGWTMVAIDTASGSSPYIYTQTTSSTPYTGWTAPSTVYNGEWSQSAAVHPLSRTWWHQWTVPVEGGGLVSVASDSNNSGGTAWSLVSWDNGATWSVKALSYYKASAAGGPWYRPSLCVINDGGAQSLKLYTSTLSWMRGPTSVQPGTGGFYIYSARLKTDLTKTALQRALIRDAVNRNLTSPVALTTYGLLAWDSFNRASLGTTLESGQSWTVATGAFTIVSNQLSCSTTGNIIMDTGVQNYDVECRIVTVPATPEIFFIINYQDNLNLYRMGLYNTVVSMQKVIGGGVPYGASSASLTFVAGDVVRISKRGPYYSLYINDRIAMSYYDTYLQSKTVTGLFLTAGTVIDNFIVYQS